MTTEKQSAANKANAKKSTGPRTKEGKQVVSSNAIKHGILANRLLLAGEDPAEFYSLQAGLIKSLSPVGILELSLVEKIAVALWKQRRMVASESAAIELARSMSIEVNRKQVKSALGLDYSHPDIDESELADIPSDDQEQSAWVDAVQAEFNALNDGRLEKLAEDDLQVIAQTCPLMWEQFQSDSKEAGKQPEDYLASLSANEGNGLLGWVYDLSEYCEAEQKKTRRKDEVQSIGRLVNAKLSAPVENELMLRYQIAIDGELYRAIDALRKQQEWRIKAGIEIEAEIVEG